MKDEDSDVGEVTITSELLGGVHGPKTLDSDGLIISRITENVTGIKFTASAEGYDDVVRTYTFDLTLETE